MARIERENAVAGSERKKATAGSERKKAVAGPEWSGATPGAGLDGPWVTPGPAFPPRPPGLLVSAHTLSGPGSHHPPTGPEGPRMLIVGSFPHDGAEVTVPIGKAMPAHVATRERARAPSSEMHP